MADLGKWGGLQLRIGLPPEVQSFIDGVNGIFQVIITALDVALTVLNVVKAFVSGLLNVVKQIIEELVQLIKNLILDFRKVGFYANFTDAELAAQDTTRESLKGGYSGYQNRMITRLVDRNDLTRPNFSPSTGVIALFFYTGVNLTFRDQLRDPSQFSVILDLANGLAQLFGVDAPFTSQSSLPVAVNVSPSYTQAGSSYPLGEGGAVGIIRATTLAGRNNIVVQWNIAPAPSNQPSTGPVIPPDGFLVEVSCFPQGLYAGWLAPVEASTGGPTTGAQSYEAGFYTNAQDGEPLLIFGGEESIYISEEVDWDASFDGNTIREGARPLFFTESLTATRILKPSVIQRRADGKYLNQRTFYVDKATVRAQTWGTAGTYFTPISIDDLPLLAVPNDDGDVDADAAQPPTQVWVRVISCADPINSSIAWKWAPAAHRTPENTAVSPVTSGADGSINLGSRGTPSAIVPVMISNPQTDIYMNGVTAAITIALLSRSDLLPPSPSVTGVPDTTSLVVSSRYEPTGLESVASNLIPIIIPDIRGYFQSEGTSSEAFSIDLRSKVLAMAQFLVEQQGNLPPSLLAALEPAITRLTSWKWSDTTVTGPVADPPLDPLIFGYTILDTLAQGSKDEDGMDIPFFLAKNTRCLSNIDGQLLPIQEADIVVLDSGSLDKYFAGSYGRFTILDVSASAPVLQNNVDQVWYVRDVIPRDIYDDAKFILQIAGVPVQQPQAGSWINWRPFVGINSNIAGLNGIISEIERWSSALLSGLEGVADQIIAFIASIEQRILEIQELIRRIQSYLNIPLSITIPDALLLPLVVAGTDGVVTGLATSENQPNDGPDTYSGGAVILMGGLPSILQDLLLLAISEASD